MDCMILDKSLKSYPNAEVEAVFRQIAEQRRIVLSKGSNVDWFCSELGPEDVYEVACSAARDQLKEVLEYFGINVQESDVFSRCKECNSNAFDRAGRGLLMELAGMDAEESAGSAGSEEGAAEAAPAPAEVKRGWVLSDNSSSIAQGRTLLGAKIQIEKVPQEVLKKIEMFYICAVCGKVYWVGSHLSSALRRHKASGTVKVVGQFSDAEEHPARAEADGV